MLQSWNLVPRGLIDLHTKHERCCEQFAVFLGAQFVLIYRNARDNQSTESAPSKGEKCTLLAALLTVQRRFALDPRTAINLARNYAFLRNTFCTLHDNLLHFAEPVQQTVRRFLFSFTDCSANIITLRVVLVTFSSRY